jgi:hypothetical protein
MSLFDCSRHGNVMIAFPNLIPQLNDPAIPTAIGAQVGTNISHIVSRYHDLRLLVSAWGGASFPSSSNSSALQLL